MSAVLFIYALSFTVFATQSGDVLIYLAFVRDFILTGEWAKTDPYLYSLSNASLVWTHEYLGYLFFYAAWLLAGVAGLIFLKSIILAASFYLTLKSRPLDSNSSLLWIGLWVVAVIASSFRFIERTSLFSDLFALLLVYWLLDEKRLTKNLIIRLSLLFFIWIQIHPGFPVGLVILGIWAFWRTFIDKTLKLFDWRYLLLPVALMLINPEGLRGVTYPFEFSLNEAQTLKHFNFEWFSSYHPAFRKASEVIAFWFLIAVSLCLFILRGRKALVSLGFAFFLAAAFFGVQTVRFIPWAAFTILICIKPWAQFSAPAWQKLRFLPWAIASVLILLAAKNLVYGYVSSSGQRLPQLELDPKFFPIKTAEFLRLNPIPGTLYNTHDLGSYLIWKQQTPIFHHGFVTDMDFYRNDVMGVFRSQERFLELAKKYGWTMLVVEKHGAFRRFYEILSPLPEWKIVAEDEASFLIYKLP